MSNRSDSGTELRPAVLLDRDGTIIDETGYLGDPGGISFLPGSTEALKMLQDEGFLLIVVTNQSGVGRGYFSEEDAIAVNLRMTGLLMEEGIRVAGIYYCPHLPDEGCACRKPGTAMVSRATADFSIDPRRSWVVGDTDKDVVMGENAGLTSILLLTGKDDKGKVPVHIKRAADLREAARMIIGDGL